jgi:hypothetical protein
MLEVIKQISIKQIRTQSKKHWNVKLNKVSLLGDWVYHESFVLDTKNKKKFTSI